MKNAKLVIIENEPMAKHTSWRIGGPTRYFGETDFPDGLMVALHWAKELSLPVFLLGGGTNVLFRDAGFPGFVVRYRAQEWKISTENDDGTALLWADAGLPMAKLARQTAAQGWSGLEWAEGLPGSVGGAVCGNAGCYGGEVANVLERVHLFINGAKEIWPVAQLGYGYRTSCLKEKKISQTPIILAAEFRVQKAESALLTAKMEAIATQRRAKTPPGQTGGSVFKNPHLASETRSAGQLLDQAGLKGTRIGNAMISDLHANYIVNLGNACSDDVLRLIELAQKKVLNSFGIELELEIQVI